jgi:hypothetical protein
MRSGPEIGKTIAIVDRFGNGYELCNDDWSFDDVLDYARKACVEYHIVEYTV